MYLLICIYEIRFYINLKDFLTIRFYNPRRKILTLQQSMRDGESETERNREKEKEGEREREKEKGGGKKEKNSQVNWLS